MLYKRFLSLLIAQIECFMVNPSSPYHYLHFDLKILKIIETIQFIGKGRKHAES